MASSRSGWQFRLSAGHPEKSNLVPQRVRPLGFNLEDGHEVLSMMPGSRRQGLWNLPRGIGDQVLKVRRGERGPAFLLSRARHRGRDRRGGALASGAGCLSAVDPGYDFVLTEVFRLPYRRGPVLVGKIGLLVIRPGTLLRTREREEAGPIKVIAVDLGTRESVAEGSLAIVVEPDLGDLFHIGAIFDVIEGPNG